MSFSEIAFYHLFSSNFFCPSNYKQREIEDCGSTIKSYYNNPIDLFEREPLPPAKIKKSLRFVARLVAALFICLVLAPLGAAFNSLQLLRHTICLIPPKHRSWHLKKVSEHFWSVTKDLYIFTFAYFGMGFPAIIAAFNIKELHVLNIGFQSEKAAIYNSLALKNEFGITGPGGKLLRWNPERDGETSNPFLQSRYVQTVHLLLQIHSIQRLTENRPAHRLQYSAHPTGSSTLQALPRDLDPQFRRSLLKVDQRIALLDKFRKTSAEAKYSAINATVTITLPPFFSCNETFCKLSYDAALPIRTLDAQEIATTYQAANKNALRPAFLKYLRRILAFQTYEEVLGVLKSAPHNEIQDAYEKAMVVCNPDRNPENIDLAVKVFAFIKSAYQDVFPPRILHAQEIAPTYQAANKNALSPAFLKYLRRILAFQTYEEVLDVQKNGPRKDLEKAYRQAFLVCHPDRNPENLALATQASAFIKTAYDLLIGTASPPVVLSLMPPE